MTTRLLFCRGFFRLSPPPRCRGFRQQVVDDNAVNLKVACALLRKNGYEVARTAADGMEAFQAAEAEPFDVIFMDVRSHYTATSGGAALPPAASPFDAPASHSSRCWYIQGVHSKNEGRAVWVCPLLPLTAGPFCCPLARRPCGCLSSAFCRSYSNGFADPNAHDGRAGEHAQDPRARGRGEAEAAGVHRRAHGPRLPGGRIGVL